MQKVLLVLIIIIVGICKCEDKNETENIFMKTIVTLREKIDEGGQEFLESLDSQRLQVMNRKGSMECLLNMTEAVMNKVVLEKLIIIAR